MVAAFPAGSVSTWITSVTHVFEQGPPAPPHWVAGLPVVGESLAAYWQSLALNAPAFMIEIQKLIGPAADKSQLAGQSWAWASLELGLSVFIAFFFYRHGRQDGSVRARERRKHRRAARAAPAQGRRRDRRRRRRTGLIGTALAQALLAGIGFWIAGVPLRLSCSASSRSSLLVRERRGCPLMPAVAAGTKTEAVAIPAERLASAVAGIFAGVGVRKGDAEVVAADLVAADLEGVVSHGVMLVPMYVDRILKGSVSKRAPGDVVSDNRRRHRDRRRQRARPAHRASGGDARGARAPRSAWRRRACATRFHFGTAGRYARLMAEQNCIGIVMSNTRPLMPAPGGAEALTGNNPIAIALPSAGEFPVEVDMAMSATAMGKIRLAAAAGQSIPADWAMAADGNRPPIRRKPSRACWRRPRARRASAWPSSSICCAAGLSGGAIGADVRPLYGDPAEPYRCAQLFLAIHAGALSGRRRFRRSASRAGAARQRLETRAGHRPRLCAGRTRSGDAASQCRHLHASSRQTLTA